MPETDASLLSQNNTDTTETTTEETTTEETTTGETTTGETTTEETTTEETPTEGAPEAYEDFTLPEGVAMDELALEEFIPLAKELNLTQEQAQKLVDVQAKHIQGAAEAQGQALTEQRQSWVEAVKADTEIGGADYQKKVGLAAKTVKKFGSEELTELLEVSGLGDHPEVIRAFYKVGKVISEDTLVDGDPPPGETSFYENSDHK